MGERVIILLKGNPVNSREGTLLLNKHFTLGTFLVVMLGIIFSVSSCSPSQQPTTTLSLESGGETPSEPAIEDQSSDLSYLIESNPAEVDNSQLPITQTEELHFTGVDPGVDIAQYRLVIDGLVDNEVALTYETLLKYPTVTRVVLLICPYFFADNAEWTGVPVATLFAEAGIKSEASHLVFYSADGHYKKTLTFDKIQLDDIFLAHTVNGEVLPGDHGFPLRLVAEGEYGNIWVKWVDRIEVI